MSTESTRKFTGTWAFIISGLAVALAVAQLYQSLFGVWGAYLSRILHLTFVLILIFLLEPPSKKSRWKGFFAIDLILVGVVLVVGIYGIINSETMQERSGISSTLDLLMGGALTLLVLEATRRMLGWPLVAIVLGLLAYTFFGHYLTFGPFVKIMHPEISITELIDYLFLTSDGILGLPIDAAIRYIFIFMILASFLTSCGVAEFFNDLAGALMGHQRGGPAKISVISSALFGTISGSAAANVVVDGVFTIPAMMKVGYNKEQAGAIEATASTGGQIMPPVMAAAAFLMASFLAIPYSAVAIAAAVPACLYYVSVGVSVHVVAVKNNMHGLPKEGLPRIWDVMKKKGYLGLPILLVIYYMTEGYSVTYSGVLAIGLTFLLSMLRRETRMTPKKLWEVLEHAGKDVLQIMVVCAAAGIIVASFILTGLSGKVPYLLESIAHGSLLIGLILGAIAALILGMGMTTTAVYVIVATMVAPALIRLGAEPLAAHLFLLYFGVMANVTPPVAIAAYAGAAIAGGNLLRTTTTAFKYALGGFIIPFIFVYNKGLLLQGSIAVIFWACFTGLLAAIVLPIVVNGFSTRKVGTVERCLYFIGLLCLIHQGVLIIDVIGVLLVFLLFFAPLLKRKFVPNLSR